MEDLTEEIEDAETAEEEAKIYDIWLGGDEFSDDPIAELNARLDEAVDDDQVNTYNVVTDAEEAEKAVFAAEDTDTDPTEISPEKRVRPPRRASKTLSRIWTTRCLPITSGLTTAKS